MAGNHHSTPWRRARAQRAGAIALGASLLLAAASGPALADKVGVAAAVNPDAFSSLSGVPNKQLNIGKSIFYNERINTTASGLVQVLLVDGSTFTVGPNSDLVIDKFVYDPRKKTGELVATFSKGTMRFIGGKLSKNEGGVKVNTPSGALAIRGGMFQGSTSRGVYSFLFGHSLTFRGNNGQTQTVYETGYSLDLSGGNVNVRPTTRDDINAILTALSSPNSNAQPGTTPVSNTPNTNTTFFQNEGQPDEIINAVTQTQLQDQIQNILNDLKSKQTTKTPPSTSTQTPVQTPGQTPGETPGENPGEPPPPSKVGGDFNGYAAGFLRKNQKEPDFVGTLSPEELRLVLTPAKETPSNQIFATDASPNQVTPVVAATRVHEFDPQLPLLSVFLDYLAGTTYDIGFGGDDYLDDTSFSATSNGVTERNWLLGWNYKTKEHNGAGSFVSNAPGTALCDECNFIKWGRWGTSLGSNREIVGSWVAGDIASAGDLNELGNQRAKADYLGTAAGDVYKKVGNSWGDPVQATGRMEMSWDFAARSGRLDIYDFDNRSFGADICAHKGCVTGDNHFAGRLEGTGGLRGAAAGSFVNNGNAKAAGVIGNFGAGADRWKADGIFAGSRVPGQ